MTEETKQVIDMMKELFGTLNEKIDASHNELKDGLKELQEHVNNIEGTFSDRLDTIASDVSSMKVTLENETNKKIQFLAEGFQSVPEISEKVDSLTEDMGIVKSDIDIVKKVITTHSTELNKLGMAK